jgi:hypothetical protein
VKGRALIFAAIAASLLAACSGGGSTIPQSPSQTLPSSGGSSNSADAVSERTSVAMADQAAAATAANLQVHYYKVNKTQQLPISAQKIKPLTEYPSDLVNFGGATMATAEQHALYVSTSSPNISCTGACWSYPMTFLNDINSTLATTGGFGTILNQYVGSSATNRYPSNGHNATVLYSTIYKDSEGAYELGESDVLSILHAGVAALIKAGQAPNNPGDTHEFHIFLPQGIDHCFDVGACYAPDGKLPFYFCAYHGSTDFSDIGHVVFSVEPYQNVPGCQQNLSITSTTGITQSADSTYNTLSHEFFESVTDPDVMSTPAWYNPFTGMEIADTCQMWVFRMTMPRGQQYQLQTEYSNSDHGCLP